MPASSSAAATLRSIPSAKNRWIASFEAPLSRFTSACRAANSSRTTCRTSSSRARGVGLELDAEQVAIGEQAAVGGPHQVEDRAELVVVGTASGCLLEDAPRPLEPVADDGQEQLPLRAEQLEHVWLRDADRAGDRLGRGAGVAAFGELVERGDDDRLAAFVGGLAGRWWWRSWRVT